MLQDLDTLLDNPLLLLLVLAVGAAIGIAVERLVERQRRAERRAYWQGRKQRRAPAVALERGPFAPVASIDLPKRDGPDAVEQLRRVMAASFTARPLLNQPERRLLGVIDNILAEDCPGWRAMGQVSLGEILWSDDKEAFWAINAKRVDLLIVDADCRPLHAIEFQGTGHHHPGNSAAARDAVKKEALRRAGIGFFEVVSGDTPAQVREKIRSLAGQATVHTASPTAIAR